MTIKVDISLNRHITTTTKYKKEGISGREKGVYSSSALCGDLRNVEIFTKTIAHNNFSWVLQSSRKKSKTMVMPNSGG